MKRPELSSFGRFLLTLDSEQVNDSIYISIGA